MNLVADEGVDAQMVTMLRELGHDVYYIAKELTGINDEAILQKSNAENRILITQDKDFGELVYRLKMVHSGIILIRLMGLKASIKTEILKKVILNHEDNLLGSLVVVQPGAIRIRKFQK